MSAYLFTGCEKSLDTYEGGNGIYFDPWYEEAEILNDTIDVHWGLKKSDITGQKLILNVKLFGNTAPVDRKFSIRVETDPEDENAAKDGVDYIMPPLEYVIAAGKAETPIEIEVLRRPGLKDSPRRFRISLVESDELKFHFSRAIGYKDVTGDAEINDSVSCVINLSSPSSDDLNFISCVAEFGLILRNSKYKGTASINSVLERLESLGGYISGDVYKQEFVTLVGKASESGYYENAEENT